MAEKAGTEHVVLAGVQENGDLFWLAETLTTWQYQVRGSMLSGGSSPDNQFVLDFNSSFAHEGGKYQRVWNQIVLQPDRRFFRIFVFMLNAKNTQPATENMPMKKAM